MKRIILCAIAFLLLSIHAQSQSEKPLTVKEAEIALGGGSYAIVVGVNDYLSDDITNLKYCENDARNFAAALKAQGWLPDNVKVLTGQAANFDKIFAYIDSFVSLKFVPPDATIVFFFSGHGVRIADKNYLVPYDGSARPDYVQQKNIQLETIEGKLEKSPFKRKLLFIDACRNEFSAGTKDISANGFANISEPIGMRVFLSTEEGQFSREDDNLKSGVFTHFLVDGLSGKSDVDKNGVVVLSELELYIAKQMDQYSVASGKTQRMHSRGECDPLVPLAIVKIEPVEAQQPEKEKIKMTSTNKYVQNIYDLIREGQYEGAADLILNSIYNRDENTNYIDGVEVCNVILSSDPDNAKALACRGYFNKDIKPKESLDDSNRAINLSGVPLAYFTIGQLFCKQREQDKALLNMDKALELYPSCYLFNCEYAEFFWSPLKTEKHDFNKAISYYTKAIEINPNNYWAYYLRGMVYQLSLQEGGDYKIIMGNSIEDFKKASELKPDFTGALHQLVLIYFFHPPDLKPDYKSAIYYCDKILEIDHYDTNAIDMKKKAEEKLKK